MRLNIDKTQFLKALNCADKAVPSKSAIPVLSNFKLDLNEKGLEITGTNSDLTIKATVPYMVNGKEIIRDAGYGSILVNAHLLTEIVRNVEGSMINFDVIDNATAVISDGKFRSKLNCFRAEEYPDIDLEPSGITFDVRCDALAGMVEQSVFAASSRDTRPILAALNLEAANGKLTATATDSARLAQKSIPLEDEETRFRCNIPARTLADIVKMFEGAEVVRISVSEQKALFQFDRNVVSTRLIPGDYPVTKSIIPERFNYYLEVNAQELLSAMRRISLLSSEKDSAVKLSMKEDGVELSVKNDLSESADERVDTFQFNGDRLDVSFNPNFVIDAIRAVKSEDVTLCFQSDNRPFVVKNPRDDSVVELITPMRSY